MLSLFDPLVDNIFQISLPASCETSLSINNTSIYLVIRSMDTAIYD